MEWNNFITELLGIKGWKVTWKGFQWRFKEHCHSVQIIYDKFHIVRHLWLYTSRTWAMKFWDKWKEQLKWMGYYFQHFVMRPFYKDGIDRED